MDNHIDINAISLKLEKLHAAVDAGLPRRRCLRRWSEFIRERDGHRCVDCHSRQNLSAHHICRKAFLEHAQYQTGNGITLCRSCHTEHHRGFNGKPDLSMPVDAQGGEKLPMMERLYSILTDDAVERGLMYEEFYYLSDGLLGTFKNMQGYAPETQFPGSRIEQAYLILAECEFDMRRAIAEANGFHITSDPVLPGGIRLILEDGDEPEHIIIQRYRPRSS